MDRAYISASDVEWRVIVVNTPTGKWWGSSSYQFAGEPPKHLLEVHDVHVNDVSENQSVQKYLHDVVNRYMTSAAATDRVPISGTRRTATRIGEWYVPTNQYLWVEKHNPSVTWWYAVDDPPLVGAKSKGKIVALIAPIKPERLEVNGE